MTRREAWDWQTDQAYTPRGRVRPGRARLVEHTHTCPDGTLVVVAAQYIAITGVTLYRWTIGGVMAAPTHRAGDSRDVPPDWTHIDASHTVAA